MDHETGGRGQLNAGARVKTAIDSRYLKRAALLAMLEETFKEGNWTVEVRSILQDHSFSTF